MAAPAVHILKSPEELALTVPMPPTGEEENARWRQKILNVGGNDPRWAQAFVLRGNDDPVWWINTWGVTQNPKDYPKDPHRPLVLFPKQETYIRTLDRSVVEGRELLLEKSREQGASVVSANYCGWRLMTQINASMKIGSRVKDLVDGDSFADQIMPKIDYTLEAMPAWALPPGFTTKKPSACRKNLMLRNPVTGKVLKGEPTNKHFSVSGRYVLVWLDEVSKIETMNSIHKSVANTTNCYLYTTTPEGYEFFARMVASGKHPVFRLHWTDNPLWLPKGYALGVDCDWENGCWPEEWVCKPGCQLHPDGGKPHSERYDRECEKLSFDPRTVAQELDIDYQKSGGAVFDPDTVRRTIVHLDGLKPEFRYYELKWVLPSQSEALAMTDDPDGWYIASRTWTVQAIPADNANLRVFQEPDPTHIYCVGGDTGKGLAHGDASCLPVWDATAGMTVAEWYGRLEPTRLGVVAAQIAKWYGTSSGCEQNAWTAIEWNGDGETVNAILAKMGILGHRSKSADQGDSRRRGRRYKGVLIPPNHKRRFIDKYLVPLISKTDENGLPELIDPFPEFWRECETFVEHAPQVGKINPEIAKVGGMIGCHDDRVMARLSMIIGVITKWGRLRGNVGPLAFERMETERAMMEHERAVRIA